MATQYDGTDEEERALNAYIRFTRAFDTIDRRIGETFRARDLTSGQFGVLESIYHLGPMYQGQLGDKLLQSKGNISTIVKQPRRARACRASAGRGGSPLRQDPPHR